jgi:ATP-dependent helicase/DNAse subunit B
MQLLLARVGAGKTLAVQARLLALKRQHPLAKVWVLLSTERQIADFRARFMQHSPVSFNVETFNFYSLYHHLLGLSGNPQRTLDDTARFSLIRALLADLYPDGAGIFGSISQTPGFIRIIAAFLYELKQNLVDPDVFQAVARTPKEVELASIYNEYQLALIRHNLVDREGEGWLALEAVEQVPEIAREVDLLLVDGYDQFNPLQAALLTALGAHVRDSLVTLTTIPGREATIGRRFAEALDRLQAAHAARGYALDTILYTAPIDQRDPALRHLSEQLLLPAPARIDVDSAVYWLEAPDPSREVGMVLRRVKALLLNGCAPDDIMIAVRDWALYGGQLVTQGRVYNLPLALHYGDPLAGNPALVALLDLLALHQGDFRRRALLDTLRSPYFRVPGLDAERVDLLERISLEMRITGGRAAWLEAVALMLRPPEAALDDDNDAEPLDLGAAQVSKLHYALASFFDAVTPPERGSVATYVLWLEGLIGQDLPDPEADPEENIDAEPVYTLDMPTQIRADADAAMIARDLAAMQGFKRLLRGLLSAQALAGSLGYARQTDRCSFLRDLRTAVDSTTVERGTRREGRVLVTTVADARGLSHGHIFILGLSEGLFPQPAPEDPLLLDSERRYLSAQGIVLPTQAERAGDDGLFYGLIGQAREALILSRTHSKNGEPWAPSHLWRASRAVFTSDSVKAQTERLKLGEVPAEPATQHEAALVAADRLLDGKAASHLLRGVDSAYWARIRQARDLELRRMSTAPHDQYGGKLNDPNLIGWVGQYLNEDRVWSASQLNDYGVCGFRYFSSRLLKLEPLEEPEDGMDIRQLGTLYHEILEATYARLSGTIAPERVNEALAVLHDVAAEHMPTAPERLRFRASPQWAQEQTVLLRRLERLVRADFSGENPLSKQFGGQPREIYRQEAWFGGLQIDLGGGDSLRVRGSIDRIDRQDDRVIVVDYKTGSKRFPKEETARGRNFQMMVYLLAAQAVVAGDTAPDAPSQVAGGLFWQIGGESLGVFTDADAEVIDAGREHLSRYLSRARSGDFATHANQLENGKCAAYCDFHQFCRAASTNRRKA